jgi:DNA-binding transcriptional MerR regulator
MKIKQVCELTGLSERTVRFYESELLIRPASRSMNQRRYRDYSQADVAALTTFAGLRRAFFSIQEIRDMMQSPDRIPAILEEFKVRAREEAVAKTQVVGTLEALDAAELRDVTALSAALRQDSMRNALPPLDTMPHFGRFDGISKEERERVFQEYLQREGLPRSAYRAKRVKERFARVVARKGWIAIVVLLAVLLTMSIVWTDVATHDAEYRRQQTRQEYEKWNVLHRMFERVDGSFQAGSDDSFPQLLAYVNTTCYDLSFSGLVHGDGNDALDGRMLLIYYDQLFQEIGSGPFNDREAAHHILIEMNGDLLQLSKKVVDGNVDGMERFLDPATEEAKELQSGIKALSMKYRIIMTNAFSHDGAESN